MHLISLSPTDCGVLAKLGQLFDDEGDESQALHHYTEVKGAFSVLAQSFPNLGVGLALVCCCPSLSGTSPVTSVWLRGWGPTTLRSSTLRKPLSILKEQH